MSNEITKRIASLRSEMGKRGVAAFIIPSTDPHMSEYVSEHWKARRWISGFTGSAGTAVVAMQKAGLWTDSRYFIQAAQQLEGSGMDLYKEMLPETPSIAEFLASELSAGDCVGVDGHMYSVEQFESLSATLGSAGISLKCFDDVIDAAWTDRPAQPMNAPFIYNIEYAGESAESKIAKLRKQMADKGVEGLLITALDEVAWTINMRGDDVECNPVFTAYLLLTHSSATLFIDPAKLNDELKSYLSSIGVDYAPYADINAHMSELSIKTLQMETSKTNFSVFSAVNSGCRIIRSASPVAIMKAVRNDTEIAGVRKAMKRDGVALVRLLHWLDENVAKGGITEVGVAEKLDALRAEVGGELYKGVSFETIAGYGEHGAIVHYEATEETDVELKPKGFLLMDVGAQYLDGTTDVTRTIALGALTDEEKTDYTLILKGHIALAMARFPEGTRGAQLDILARMPIWQHNMNYLHGTGHGVGHFLNVHEGPESIRMNENPVTFLPGMVMSNEPGVYKAGKHGIRTENVVLVKVAGEGMFGRYFEFETITLCPICTKGILKEMLTAEELEWLNTYQKRVYNELADSLNESDREWLKNATQAI